MDTGYRDGAEIVLSRTCVVVEDTDTVLVRLAWARIFLSLSRAAAVGTGYPGGVRIFLSRVWTVGDIGLNILKSVQCYFRLLLIAAVRRPSWEQCFDVPCPYE